MKKVLSIACAMAICFTMLAGCGSSATSSSTTGANKKTTITLIQNKVEIQQQLEAAAKDFNSTHKNIEVQILGAAGDNLVTTLQSQFASTPAKAPTIFTCGSGSEFEKFFNYMAPMDSCKAKSIVAKGQADDAMKDGKLYGLPMAVEGFGLIYNKSILDKAGVKPEDITSMDTLVDACKKISKVQGVVKPIGFAKETYFQFMQPFNWAFVTMSNYKDTIAKVNNGQLKLKDIPEVKQYVNDLAKLKPYTNLAKDSYDDQLAGFATGKYAMIHQGNWAESALADYKVTFDYGMIGMPANGNTNIAVGNTNFFHVNKYATKDQQDAAMTFLDWMFTDKAGQKYITDKFKLIPAYDGFDTSSMSPLAKQIQQATVDAKTAPWVFNLFPAGVDKDGASAMEKFYAGKSTPDQLLDEINNIFVNASQK